MKIEKNQSTFALLSLAILVLVGPWATASAGDGNGLNAHPFAFVAKAGECGAGYPAGAEVVTANWLKGMGLPDNGGLNVNTSDPADAPNKKDQHYGLLLSKNSQTEICSASGASISGVKGIAVTSTFTLGYDYRNGGHCGAGAPRFNVSYTEPNGAAGFAFVGGCANDNEASLAAQDPTEWTRVRHVNDGSDGEYFPPIPVGSTITSISIVFDEGTDTANNDIDGVGLAVLDNIFINGVFIAGPGGSDD
jgi:hypothetical protein